MSDYLEEEVPRYRKKSRKGSPPKSNHKHKYERCVFVYPEPDYRAILRNGRNEERECRTLGTYCPICGKIGNIALFWSQSDLTDENARQLNPQTSTLPTFRIDNCWCKQISNYDSAQNTP